MTEANRYEHVTVSVSEFATEREWEQFHTPKNLAMALAGEVGELVAEFQWLTPEESALQPTDQRYQPVSHEIADVFILVLRLAEVLDLDLLEATMEKLRLNAEHYPVELSRGRSGRPTN